MCDSFEHGVSPEGGNVLRLVIKLIQRRKPEPVDWGAVKSRKTQR
jgi:hypothetical protein